MKTIKVPKHLAHLMDSATYARYAKVAKETRRTVEQLWNEIPLTFTPANSR